MRKFLVEGVIAELGEAALENNVKLRSTVPCANEAGFCEFWNSATTPKMRPVVFLSSSVEISMTLSFHNGNRTSRAFADMAKITAAVYFSYTGIASRCRLMIPFMLRSIRMQTLGYDVIICVDMSMATENFHVSSSNYKTFCMLTSQEMRAYLAIVVSLIEPMVAIPLCFFCNVHFSYDD